MEDEEVVIVNTDFLLTESTVTSKLPIDQVEAWLRERKKTGQLVHHLSQGGIQKIALVEKTKVPEEKRKQVRDILGV